MRKIALVGMAETSRHLAPFDDPAWEIWGLNEAYAKKNKGPDKTPYMKRWDVWFQMHPLWDALRLNNFNHLNHPLWLRNQVGQCLVCGGRGQLNDKECEDCGGTGFYDPATDQRNKEFPIYLISESDEIANGVRYPLKGIVEHFTACLREDAAAYMTSTFPMMLALIVYQHDLGHSVGEVGFYGIEMKSTEEYAFQKPCMEFWMGVLLGRQVGLTIPEGCALLGETERLYGYQKIQGQYSKMHSEIRARALQKECDKAQAKANKIIGEREAHQRLMAAEKGQTPKRQKLLMDKLNELIQAEINGIIRVNSYNSALQEQKYVSRELAAQLQDGGIWIVKPKGGRERLEIEDTGIADSDIAEVDVETL